MAIEAMSPPKTDAFADLLSGKLSPRNAPSARLSMGERLSSPSPSTGSRTLDLNRNQHPNGGHYQDLDMLLGGGSVSAAPVSTGARSSVSSSVDVDGLLGIPSSGNYGHSSSSTSILKQNSINSHTFEGSARIQSSESLLDDEFTDAFTATPKPTPTATPFEASNSALTQNLRQSRSQGSSVSSRVESPVPSLPPRRVQKSSRADDRRDTVLAELIDIGFSVEASNDAIDECGYNLQSCVNYIMSKAAGNDDGAASAAAGGARSSSRTSQRPNDMDNLTKSINDVSVDIFNMASSFLYKSKRTVMKNLADFQNGGPASDNGMPAWMRDQQKHKGNAIEKQDNGEFFEDYGTDEDNIDQAAIEDFMRKQKLKDKERAKHRFDNMRTSSPAGSSETAPTPPAKSRTSQGRASSEITPALPKRSSRTNSGNSSVESGSRPVSRTQTNSPAPLSQPQPSRVVESDLLDLGTPMDRFRSNNSSQDNMYVSSARRRAKPAAPSPAASAAQSRPPKSSTPRLTVSTPLNQFHQSDYDVAKRKATEFYTNGDYQNSLIEYQKCLEPLSENHELRIVIFSNILINCIKLGDYKQALDASEKGLALIAKENINDTAYVINEKPIKAWYTRLLSRKAESLEMLELFPKALEAYTELISLGTSDKKVMDGRRRVNNIVNPPVKKPVSAPKKTTSRPQKPKDDSALKMVKAQNEKTKQEEEKKFELYDDVHDRLFQWSNGKEDNIRTLLIALPSILPERLGFPFLTTKKITLNDLMLPKKVKINYMKVIGCLHPDKTQNLEVEDKMICQGVFVILNKSWDIFKEQNGMS